MTEPQNPTLEQVRARRKAIAEEDAQLEIIEHNILAISAAWRSLYHSQSESPITFPTSLASPSRIGAITPIRTNIPVPKKRLTKREMIIEALNAPRDLWQLASSVQAYVSSLSSKEVPMSSISPELTAMKNNGTIVRNDKFVALALRIEVEGKTNEAPPEQADGASKPGIREGANFDDLLS